ncbi:MAG: histidine kinase dimerization/phosphoacceptor domain -containing protein [Pseudomonadota bacterium]
MMESLMSVMAIEAEVEKGNPLAISVQSTRMPMILTDPNLHDNPIVFANPAFHELTGYGDADLIGRNCRLLQGPETDPGVVDEIRASVAARKHSHRVLVNYRKDGSRFWNELYTAPIFGEDGSLRYFFASQLDVSERIEAEAALKAARQELEEKVAQRTKALQGLLDEKMLLIREVDHRVKNNFQLVSSLLAIQAQTVDDPAAAMSLHKARERIQALAGLHRRIYQSRDVEHFNLTTFVEEMSGDLIDLARASGVGFDLDLDTVYVDIDTAGPMTLLVNEIVQNALKHAFPGREGGTITITLTRDADKVVLEVADDGVGLDEGRRSADSGFGMQLIRMLTRQLGADHAYLPKDRGTQVRIRLPDAVDPRGDRDGLPS